METTSEDRLNIVNELLRDARRQSRGVGENRHAKKRRLPIHRRLERFSQKCKDLCKRRANHAKLHVPLSLSARTEAGAFEDSIDDIYGDQLLANIMRTINEFGTGVDRVKLRVDQHTMLSHSIAALLPLIYKHKLEANRDRLLKTLKLKKISQEVVILASRRAGKTTFCAILIAALLICVPTIEIACFALALRTSQKMMRLVVDMLYKHEKGKTMIVKKNSEQLVLVGDTPYHYKILHAFPDTVHVCFIFYFLFFIFLFF